MKTVKKKPTLKGKLRIGDQWNAISIIARSQTNILKAVCELVENAVDAGGKNLSIIRRQNDGLTYLEMQDDGKGIRLDNEGLPDFKYVATHICDSLKRYLDRDEKVAIHGEFGIGLLGFWGLGRELHMYSKGNDGKAYEMVMIAGKQSFNVYGSRLDLLGFGVRIVIGPLHQTTKGILTGERLQKYLSVELRDRLKAMKINLTIHDRVSRKKLKVVPREYTGEKIKEFEVIFTPLGTISLELYFSAGKDLNAGSVALAKDGTRVKKSISEILNFDHEPWCSGWIEGIIDCSFINLTPGTRDSIVHDEAFNTFAEKIAPVEKSLAAILEERKQATEEQASRTVLKDVRKAFAEAFDKLPRNEYIWFEIEKDISGKGKPSGSLESPRPKTRNKPESIPSFLDDLPGDPAGIKIIPKAASLHAGESKTLTVRVLDDEQKEVSEHITYIWDIIEGAGTLKNQDTGQCVFIAPDEPVKCIVEVRVRYGRAEFKDTCRINVTEQGLDDGYSQSIGQGLPAYKPVAAHGESWRSRYIVKDNIIEINAAHSDFLTTRENITSHKRYIAKLYAKEIVILNFPNISQNDSLERIIELLVKIEKLI